MGFPFLAAAVAGGAGLNFLGGLLGNRSANRQREQQLAQTRELMEYLRSQGIQNPEQWFQQAVNPLLQFGTDMAGFGGPWMRNFLDQNQFDLVNFLHSGVREFSQPSDMVPYYNSPQADVGRRYDPILDMIQQRMAAGDPAFDEIIDRLTQTGRGEDQPLAALLEGGTSLVNQQGATGYSLNAQDAAGRAISAGGTTPYSNDIFSRGQALFDTGGYSPNLSGLSDLSLTNLQGLMPGGAGRTTQSDVLGPAGNTALAGLLGPVSSTAGGGSNISAPQFTRAFNQALSSGYTPQNLTTFEQGTQGLRDLLNRNGQIDSGIAYAQQAFSGNLPGQDVFGDQLAGLIAQLSSGGGGFSGGGGGATGASAGSMGPMDPQLAEYLAKGLEYFKNNPLMSQEDMVSFARDAATTAGRQRAQAMQRYAAAQGGGGPLVNTGAQNQAYADFADEMMQAEAAAVRDASLKWQDLALAQQMRGGELGLAAANADTNRQQVAASRDIASANNQTSASIANAQIGSQQAQIAAQLRQAGLQAAAQAALGARGQNYGRSQAGLEALQNFQAIANTRGDIFNRAALGALGDATNRYQVGMSTLPALFEADVQRELGLGQLHNQRYDTALEAAIRGSEIGGNQSNQLAQIMAQLGLGTEQLAASRATSGLEAMLGAGDLANRNLSTMGTIGNAASQDQLQRLLAGTGMLNANLETRLRGLDMMGNAATARNNTFAQQGQLFNQGAQTQADIWNRLFNLDLQNRTLGQEAYNNTFRNLLSLGGLGGQFTQLGLNPLQAIAGNMADYSSGSQRNLTQLGSGMLGQTPQQQPPWPQININPNAWQSAFGGFGSGGGTVGLGNTPAFSNPVDISNLLGGFGGLTTQRPTTPPFVSSPRSSFGFNANDFRWW